VDVTATFQLTEQDLRRALRNLPALRRAALLAVLFTLVGVLLLATGDHSSWWLAVVGPALLAVGELGVVRGGARRSAAMLAAPWTVRVTEESYTLRTPASSATVQWTMYREVTERAGYWYLQQANKAVAFLPQQAFAEDDRAQLAAFFAARLPALPRPWYRLPG
jgi:hypothetical protein